MTKTFDDDDAFDAEDERRTIVGTKLHGPTFDENYKEESEELRAVTSSKSDSSS